MSGCLGPAPEDKKKKSRVFSFFFLSVPSLIVAVVVLVWRVLFGSLKGTGTLILGKQGSKTSEGCLRPAPEDGGNRTFFPFFFLFLVSAFWKP